MAHQGKLVKNIHFVFFSRSMEKIAWDGAKWGREGLFPANPYLADILGRADLHFEIFHSIVFLNPKFLDFQVSRFPNS